MSGRVQSGVCVVPSHRNRLSACRPARVIVQAASEYKTGKPRRAPALDTQHLLTSSFPRTQQHCLSLSETYRPSRQLLLYHPTHSINMPPKKSTTTATKKSAPAPAPGGAGPSGEAPEGVQTGHATQTVVNEILVDEGEEEAEAPGDFEYFSTGEDEE